MKKLILPLLILLTCSICYGKSLRILAICKDDEYTLEFLDSDDKTADGKITFFVRDEKIDFSKNQKEFKMLVSAIASHFKENINLCFNNAKISENSITSYHRIESLIKRLAVTNNYQVTLQNSHDTGSLYIFEIFLYKADK